MKKYLVALGLLAAVLLIFQTANAKDYSEGTVLRSIKTKTLYYVDKDQVRHLVPSVAVLKTWLGNYKVLNVPQSEAVPPISDRNYWGKPLPVKVGTKLVKFENSPAVYFPNKDGFAVDQSQVLIPFPDENTAKFVYGSNWNKNIIELPEVFAYFYTVLSPMQAVGANVVDNEKPTISISVKPFSSLVPDNMSVEAKASDDVGIRSIDVYFNVANGIPAVSFGCNNCSEYSMWYKKALITNYEAVATDLKGNTSTTGVINFTQ